MHAHSWLHCTDYEVPEGNDFYTMPELLDSFNATRCVLSIYITIASHSSLEGRLQYECMNEGTCLVNDAKFVGRTVLIASSFFEPAL